MKFSIIASLVLVLLGLGACSSPESKSNESNPLMDYKASILKSNNELFNKGNLDYADEVFASNYAKGGPEWIKEYIEEMRTAFPDLTVSVEPIIAEENKVAWLRTHTGTHQGAIMGFEPTGKKITWQTMIYTEYDEEGKISHEQAVGDLFEMLYMAQETAPANSEE